MTVRDAIKKYEISLQDVQRISQNPLAKLKDVLSDFGVGFIEGYTCKLKLSEIAKNSSENPYDISSDLGSGFIEGYVLKFNESKPKKKIKKQPTKKPIKFEAQKPETKGRSKIKPKKRKYKSVRSMSVPMGGNNKWKR